MLKDSQKKDSFFLPKYSVFIQFLFEMVHNFKASLAKKAKEELFETDAEKKQALEEFRMWLKKHSYLKNTRSGK